MMFPEINVRVIPGIVCNNRGAMYRALKSTPSNFCAKKSCRQTEGSNGVPPPQTVDKTKSTVFFIRKSG